MSVSIYYTCTRETKLSSTEQQEVTTMIDQFNADFKHQDIAESFYVYDYDEDEPTEIFTGSTKLPITDNFEDTIDTLYYWLDCLTNIRRSIAGGDWHVHMDEVDVEWDETEGWVMPSNG